MSPAARNVTRVAVAAALLLDGPILDVLGWPYASPAGSAFTKIMPAAYLFAVGSVLSFVSERRARSIVTMPAFYCYAAAVLLVVVRSLFMDQSAGGELSTAIVSFGTPCLALICLQDEAAESQRLGLFVRAFFVFNSLMALTERMVGHRFIPSDIDIFPGELRSSGLLGHPLGGAMLTGELILILVISPRRDIPPWLRIAEIVLHGLAMFAFGGRTALVFIPVLLVASALFARARGGEAQVTLAQRAAPIAIVLIGLIFVFLPIPFVEATLQRFTEDNGSALTRDAALKILGTLDHNGLMWGIDIYQRQVLMKAFNTSQGVELGWVALIVNYGLIVIIPLLVTLMILLFRIAWRLDRSATYMAIFSLVLSAGSAGLAGKGLQITLLFVFMQTLCQRPRLDQQRPSRFEDRRDDSDPLRFLQPSLDRTR